MKRKIAVLGHWKDHPNIGSGYGKCCAYISPYLKSQGYDIALVAAVGQKYFRNYWNDIYVFPGTDENVYAENVVLDYLKEWRKKTNKPTILFQQADVWPLQAIPALAKQGQITWVLYPAIDYDPIPQEVIDKLYGVFRIIPMCEWVEKLLRPKLGDKIMKYVHHGVDEKIYHPFAETKEKIQNKYPETTKSLGFEKDTVNISIVAANQIFRKPWDIMFQIVKTFRERNPDLKVRLYCHTIADVVHGGWDLVKLRKLFQLEDITVFSDPALTVTGGYPETVLSRIYNVSDVVLYTTCGEGFGLPVIESMACGTPVLTTDFSATSELVEPFPEFKVKVGSYFLIPRPLLVKANPDVDDAVEKMTKIVNSNPNYYLKKCSQYADKKFAWKKILPEWKKRFEDIEKAFDEECVEIPKSIKKSKELRL